MSDKVSEFLLSSRGLTGDRKITFSIKNIYPKFYMLVTVINLKDEIISKNMMGFVLYVQ